MSNKCCNLFLFYIIIDAIDTNEAKVDKFFMEAKDAKPDARKQEFMKIKEVRRISFDHQFF